MIRTMENTEVLSNSSSSVEKNSDGLRSEPLISVPGECVAMFISRALEQIITEKQTRKPSNNELREACCDGIEFLKTRINLPENGKNGSLGSDGYMPTSQAQRGALLNDEKLLRPLELACKSKSPKIVAISLDCLQKLIAYGHIPNNALDSSGKEGVTERIVQTICSCFNGVNTDEGVQLQVIKALLTVVTSPVVEVHERDILLVVRTCYNIYMATRNLVNQTTARATLTQMLNVIFQRMEQATLDAAVRHDQKLSEAKTEAEATTDGNGIGIGNYVSDQQNAISEGKSDSESLDGEKVEEGSVDQEEILNEPAFSEVDQTETSQEESIVTKNDNGNIKGGNKECISEMESTVGTHNAQEKADGQEAKATSDEASEEGSSAATPDDDEEGVTGGVVDAAEATPITEEEISKPNSLHPSVSASSLGAETTSGSATDSSDEIASSDFYFAHISQKDAFLVFRSLCKLAMKPLAGTNPTDPKSHELRSKILSLQLLLSILQQPGPAFRSNAIFITAIKQYLCVALSKNGVSSVPEVFELSLAIFLSLLTHFKQHLKIQIEVFFKEMLFAVLDSSSASFEHKWIVTEALQRICMDKQCIVDAYLNYDCDLERANVFEKLVICLAKVAQGRPAVDTRTTQPQLQNLRKKGLECLVLILKCMVRWSSDLFNVTNETHSFLGSEPSNASAITKEHDTDSGSSVRLNQTVQDDPEAFESRKALKEVYEAGIYLFNRGKVSRGLALLQENNLLGTSAEDVAMFLHNESRLCRTAIGDFLGENEAFALEVMYAYVDCFDFSGFELLPALRSFLSGFWLPGEAQKIDRLMEKFAARYYACNLNNTLFASADTAYVLAFSIIMLTTDLHSEKIKQKQKMSKEDYIKMNRGINDSHDLPREYLGKIYDEIAQCGIQMRSDDISTVLANNGTLGNSTNGVVTGVKGLMESVSHMESEFTCATHFEHVRPMFKLVWTPFLAAFSVGLQDCDDPMIAHHCLEGIQCAIRIACTFRMELERDAYVQALARFTLLLSTSQSQSDTIAISGQGIGTMGNHLRGRLESVHSQLTGSNSSINSSLGTVEPPSVINPTPEMMKSKNVDSIRTLISVAQTDGNYLGHSWLHILRCISQLESANVIATNTARSLPRRRHGPHATPEEANVGEGEGQNKSMRKRSGLAPGSLAAATVDSRKAAVLQEVMGETGSRSVVVAVDKIFSGSVRLDGDAIVDFVQALCQVSLEELALPQPRTFSLQKVVEISYYNIGRIRLQWSRIWEHIGQHFTTAGRSANEDVAIFAVDSLRQLVVKLMERGELPNFHFQKECIRPFLNILDDINEVEPSIQDMVARCVLQLIQSQWPNIRSGWTNIFLVLYTAAASAEEGVIELAFSSCSFVINTVFPNNFYLLINSFPIFIKALAEFACNLHFPDISMEAIRLIRLCARIVSERAHQFSTEESNLSKNAPATETASSEENKEDDALWKRGWMPILYELFRIINNCKLDVRTRGLTVFFEVIKSYGSTFHLSWWVQIFKLVFSIFEHGRDTSLGVTAPPHTAKEERLRQNSRHRLISGDQLDAFTVTYHVFTSPADRSEWLNTTCNHALYSVVDIFSQFFDQIGDSLLANLYEQLKWCCLQDHEQLARSGASCLETIVLTNGSKFNDEKWIMTISLLVDLFKTTVPNELLTWRPGPTVDGIAVDEAMVKRRQSACTRLFLRLLVNCIVQYELIQTVDNILFFPSRSRQEDALILQETRRSSAQLNSQLLNGTVDTSSGRGANSSLQVHTPEEKRLLEAVAKDGIATSSTPSTEPSALPDLGVVEELVNGALPLHKKATFPYISYDHRLTLVHCLMESHKFAKTFNSNMEQRNILWEAGFKAKAKPNLLKQETHSLSTALRILFKISEEKNERQQEVTEMLQKTIEEAIAYYRGLPVDGHRQAWDSCLLLTLTRLVHLSPDSRFASIATRLYPTVCDLVGLPNLSPEVSVLLRAFLLRKKT
ncbi:Brefeldin A-inhibited guanine nucleotide-exchange protein 2 [Echinococcus granulosus]|uniref:Brefeldin A inhibited guanine n=1 Tax=Echinococcus granulosus TaxID=6210 RepID=A0A068WTC7_ECHGR|nr:Brefeldin A-inhibited guanine nucleotide-exchange protein 2 [Echinococcus granulosus]CDS23073.1 brefeldin A inhibited guanine [Echinococcus granulosus]